MEKLKSLHDLKTSLFSLTHLIYLQNPPMLVRWGKERSCLIGPFNSNDLVRSGPVKPRRPMCAVTPFIYMILCTLGKGLGSNPSPLSFGLYEKSLPIWPTGNEPCHFIRASYVSQFINSSSYSYLDRCFGLLSNWEIRQTLPYLTYSFRRMGKYPFIEVIHFVGGWSDERRWKRSSQYACRVCNWEQEPWYSKIYG